MSTQIETNTEELNEILQTVYNLPNRSSGGDESYDLLFRLETPEGKSVFGMFETGSVGADNFYVVSGNLADVRSKLKASTPVKCGVVLDVYYWDMQIQGFASFDDILVWDGSIQGEFKFLGLSIYIDINELDELKEISAV